MDIDSLAGNQGKVGVKTTGTGGADEGSDIFRSRH